MEELHLYEAALSGAASVWRSSILMMNYQMSFSFIQQLNWNYIHGAKLARFFRFSQKFFLSAQELLGQKSQSIKMLSRKQ